MAKKEIVEEAEAAPAPKTSNQEADQMAADEGFVWGLELHYFTQHSRKDLLAQGYSESDLDRVDRVLALKDMKVPARTPAKAKEEDKPAQSEG
jgi:hypothetical protein